MPLLEPRNHTTALPEYRSLPEAQDKDLKISFMNMIDISKEKINKSLKKQ